MRRDSRETPQDSRGTPQNYVQRRVAGLYSGMFATAAPLAVNTEQKPELEALVRNGNSPRSANWGLVERFFALITGRMIRRGTFRSAERTNWEACAGVILDKVRGCKELSRTGD